MTKHAIHSEFSDIGALSQALRERKISARELAESALHVAQDHSSLNAFTDIQPELTLAQADAADQRLAAGHAGPLTGIPIAHKDIFVTRVGIPPPPAKCSRAMSAHLTPP
jgi:aspartyl-tRNA(Asn)/glutamyl-tRNA(Gln) amidotransferase subunit A